MSSQPGETRIKKNRCTVYFTLACFALGVSVGLVQFCKGFFPLTPLDAPQAQPFSKTGDYKHKLALVFTDTIDTNMSTNGLSMINQRVTQGQGRFFRTRAQATVPGSMHFHLWSVLTGATPTLADTVLRRRVLPEANLANSFAVQGRRVAYDGLFEDNTMKTIVPHATRLSRREEAKGLSWDMLLAHKSSGRVDRYVESVLNAVAGGESDDEEYAKGHGNAIVMMAVVGMDGGAAILSNEFALWKAENEVKEIHLVDICPTVALLAETNIPYGSTGAAVSTLLGGESKTLEGLSKNAEQLKCLMKMRSEKHSNKRNNDNDEDDGFMVNYNMSMSSYKRYKKHKTEKNFVTSLKHFSYVHDKI